MARNLIAAFFRHNQAAKLGSFLTAVCLWLFAVSGASRTGLFPGMVPLSLTNAPDSLIATANVESVRVRLSADPTVWRQLTPGALSATVDLSGQRAGLVEVPVKLTVAVSNVQVVEILPKVIEVQLERQGSGEKRVEVTTSGEPASGLFASEATVEPGQVTLAGGQSALDRVDRVVAVVDIGGATGDRDQTVSVQPLDAAGHVVSGLVSTSSSVRVHQPLTKLAASKAVGIRVVTTGVPLAGKLISPVSVLPATATIAGSAAQLAAVTTLATKPIDLATMGQRTTIRASLDVPAGVTLINGAVVDVVFDVSDHESTLAVSPKVVVNGFAADRHVASIEPAAPSVVLRGLGSTLAALESSDVTLTVDLSGKGAGQLSVPITADLLHVPDGLSVHQIVTQSLTITIQ